MGGVVGLLVFHAGLNLLPCSCCKLEQQQQKQKRCMQLLVLWGGSLWTGGMLVLRVYAAPALFAGASLRVSFLCVAAAAMGCSNHADMQAHSCGAPAVAVLLIVSVSFGPLFCWAGCHRLLGSL